MDPATPARGERDGRRPGPAGPAAAATPSVLGRLGPYRLLQVVGGGGMGVVHLGLDPGGRAVAIKVLRPHVAADPSARSRLAREVDALQRVRSPRVAEVLDADPGADQPYIVTQFVPAPPLDVLVEREGPLTGRALGRVGLGLGDALAAIHAAGVVHRDLKPGNVLVDDGEPVVIDFGIAQVADDVRLTSAGLVMGTPGYLSPEVLDGASVATTGDWWGWAATLAFAATGRPPFGRGPTEAVLSRVRRGEADLAGAPAALAGALAAALSPDPAHRPPPRRLRQAVQALVDGADDAWPVPSGARPSRSGSSVATTALPGHGPLAAPAAGPLKGGAAATVTEASAPQVLPAAAATGLPDAPPEAAPVPWPEPPRRDAATTVLPDTAHAATAVVPAGAPSARPAAQAPPVADSTRVLPAEPRVFTSPPRTPVSPVSPVPTAGGASAPTEHVHPFHRPPQLHQPGPQQPEPSPYAPVGPPGDHVGAHRPPDGPPATSAVLLLLLLVAVALGAVAPLVAAMAVAGAVVVARTVDRAVAASARRRYERGPRRSDGAVVAFALPGQLVLSALASVPALLLPAAMAVSTAFLVGWAIAPQAAPVPGQALPLASAVLVGTATAWWGPGGRTVRRGGRTAVRGALPRRTGSLVAVGVLVLVLVGCVLVVASAGGQPDWTPLTSAPLGLG